MADSPSIANDIAAGVKVDHRPWPGNKAGLRITREVMAKKIREGMHTPSVRALAGQILRDAGFPKTIQAKAEAIRSYVKSHVDYAPDPMFSEMVVAAPVTLCLPDGIMCMPVADCDDATVACQSLIGAAGMDARFFHIEYGGNVQTHMMGAVKDEANRWLEVDATTDRRVGYETKCSRKALVDPFDDKTFDITGAGGGSFIGVGKAFGADGKPWDTAPMQGYAQAIFGRQQGAGAPPVTLTCGSKFTMQLSGSGPNAASPPALPAGFTTTSADNQGTINGATVWALEGTYNGPPLSPTSFDNIYYGTNYPWSVVTASVTPPLVPMIWNGTSCVTDPGGHTPCPAGTYWNGSACIHQVVFQPPSSASAPIHTSPGIQHGGTSTGGSQSPAGSSNKGYYIAAGVVAALGIGTALVLWKVAP